jgi:hypothetical protein
MNITGLLNVFVKELDGKNGKFKKFTGSISTKKESGETDNATIGVIFSKELNKKAQALETTKAYTLDVKDAWLKFDKYEKDGKKNLAWYIFINKATVKSSTEIKKVDEDVPF